MTAPLTDDERRRIIGLLRQGLTTAEIRARTGRGARATLGRLRLAAGTAVRRAVWADEYQRIVECYYRGLGLHQTAREVGRCHQVVLRVWRKEGFPKPVRKSLGRGGGTVIYHLDPRTGALIGPGGNRRAQEGRP